MLRSQGVYVSDTPMSFSIKSSFAGFQLMVFASGEMTAPTSPMAPERVSGVMIRKATVVVKTLFRHSSSLCDICAKSLLHAPIRNMNDNILQIFISVG